MLHKSPFLSFTKGIIIVYIMPSGMKPWEIHTLKRIDNKTYTLSSVYLRCSAWILSVPHDLPHFSYEGNDELVAIARSSSTWCMIYQCLSGYHKHTNTNKAWHCFIYYHSPKTPFPNPCRVQCFPFVIHLIIIIILSFATLKSNGNCRPFFLLLSFTD